MVDDDPYIRYTTKELLAEIKRQLDTMQSEMRMKADLELVLRIDRRVATLESSDAVARGVKSNNRWLIVTIIGLMSMMAALGGVILVVT